RRLRRPPHQHAHHMALGRTRPHLLRRRPQPPAHTLRPAHSHDPRRPRHLGTRPHRPATHRTLATHRMELAGPHRHIPPLPACTRPDELLPRRRPLHRLQEPGRRSGHLATPHTRTLISTYPHPMSWVCGTITPTHRYCDPGRSLQLRTSASPTK